MKPKDKKRGSFMNVAERIMIVCLAIVWIISNGIKIHRGNHSIRSRQAKTSTNIILPSTAE